MKWAPIFAIVLYALGLTLDIIYLKTGVNFFEIAGKIATVGAWGAVIYNGTKILQQKKREQTGKGQSDQRQSRDDENTGDGSLIDTD